VVLLAAAEPVAPELLVPLLPVVPFVPEVPVVPPLPVPVDPMPLLAACVLLTIMMDPRALVAHCNDFEQ
jgi:hypothetical protein